MARTWFSLPLEVMSAILGLLDVMDVWNVARINKEMYLDCLPALYRHVDIQSLESLQTFKDNVPNQYCTFVRSLVICTKSKYWLSEDAACSTVLSKQDSVDIHPNVNRTAWLVAVLAQCPNLRELSLRVSGALDQSLIPVFSSLKRVHTFRLENWCDEWLSPISERIAVHLAYALPALTALTLCRITRSAKHVYEREDLDEFDDHWICPSDCMPLHQHDEDVPPHPVLGDQLRLPALLWLPRLRKLIIRETHLGDGLWYADPSNCGDVHGFQASSVEHIELGVSPYESPQYNQQCVERILRKVASTIKEVHISCDNALGCFCFPDTHCLCSSSLPMLEDATRGLLAQIPLEDSFLHPCQADERLKLVEFPHLQSLHLISPAPSTASFPYVAHAPIRDLAFTFHPDDVIGGCEMLSRFIVGRDTGAVPYYYPAFKKLQVSVARNVDPETRMYQPNSPEYDQLEKETEAALTLFFALCKEHNIEACVGGTD